jgi:hypothetical protein
MFVTSHVLVGALIGRALARHPVGAFAAGVVSHFAMDACPHYGDENMTVDDPRFIRMAKCDGCAGLGAMAVAAGLAPRGSRRAVVAGMLGGAVVDSDKPFEYFIGWNPWPQAWNRFHKRIQNQDAGRMPSELLVAAGLAALVWKVLPGRAG